MKDTIILEAVERLGHPTMAELYAELSAHRRTGQVRFESAVSRSVARLVSAGQIATLGANKVMYVLPSRRDAAVSDLRDRVLQLFHQKRMWCWGEIMNALSLDHALLRGLLNDLKSSRLITEHVQNRRFGFERNFEVEATADAHLVADVLDLASRGAITAQQAVRALRVTREEAEAALYTLVREGRMTVSQVGQLHTFRLAPVLVPTAQPALGTPMPIRHTVPPHVTAPRVAASTRVTLIQQIASITREVQASTTLTSERTLRFTT